MINKLNNWKKIVIFNDLNIKQCLIKLNKIGSQILIVSSKSGILKGTITDGDIRRGLINGFNLKSNIEKIYNHKPFSIKNDNNIKKYFKFINDYSIKIIPIVNKKNKIIGAYGVEFKINLNNQNNKIIVMAGGRGERLRPITKNTPKPMVKINGKPILEKLILNCQDSGFSNFYLSVNYLKEKIKNYFRDGKLLNVNIEYLEERKPLGTIGSVKLIKGKILKDKKPFIVINGDIVANFDLKSILDFHISKKSDLTIVTRAYELQNPYGIVEKNMSDNIVSMEEKPIYNSEILAGIYILDYRLVKMIPNNRKFNMTELISLSLKKKKKTLSFRIDNYWYEIGNINQYNNYLENIS